ncbi:MAG: hypothetical protein ACRD5I_12995, partial [Candidatus Acidiferrales bacterium]
MKRISISLLVSLLVLICASSAQAQSVDCNNPTQVGPDGRSFAGMIPAGTTLWFAFQARGLSSYSAEANYTTSADAAFPAVGAFASTDVSMACTGASSLNPRNTMLFDPAIPNGDRLSFTPTGAGTVLVSVANGTMQARDFSFRVAETTLFNPLWSTSGGFETFYRLENTTNEACAVRLRLVADAGFGGGVEADEVIAVAAGSTAPTRNTGALDLAVPDNRAGRGSITHDCPPGAVQVDGFVGNFSGVAPAVLPIKIVAAREG